ncbi:MAG: hypothetical protein NTU83_01425, partial [Candidatus Hydrogenedentes bacterium]|nr:hypothetical protein [Candidatus Hydrogenedentota bacterium]
MKRSCLSLFAGLVGGLVLSCVAHGAEPSSGPNPHAISNPPLVKLPMAFPGPRMENTPVIFKDRPLLVQNVRPLNTKVQGFHLFVQDMITGDEITRFGETFSFVSAFVESGTLHVFATENTDDDWTHDICHFSSDDLKQWNKQLAIARKPGEHLFNTSACKDLAEQTACANPAIRYVAPYYYVIYGGWRWKGPGTWYKYRLPETKYVTFVARSKDLATWELSPTVYPMLDPVPGEGINNTDADLFEFEGNTYVFYATGDQQTWGTIRTARGGRAAMFA